jgi:hypothetical protein
MQPGADIIGGRVIGAGNPLVLVGWGCLPGGLSAGGAMAPLLSPRGHLGVTVGGRVGLVEQLPGQRAVGR